MVVLRKNMLRKTQGMGQSVGRSIAANRGSSQHSTEPMQRSSDQL